jgi:hypothetical protein
MTMSSNNKPPYLIPMTTLAPVASVVNFIKKTVRDTSKMSDADYRRHVGMALLHIHNDCVTISVSYDDWLAKTQGRAAGADEDAVAPLEVWGDRLTGAVYAFQLAADSLRTAAKAAGQVFEDFAEESWDWDLTPFVRGCLEDYRHRLGHLPDELSHLGRQLASFAVFVEEAAEETKDEPQGDDQDDQD